MGQYSRTRLGVGQSAGIKIPEALQIGGPFPNFAYFSAAIIYHCVDVIRNHAECAWLRDLVPRLHAFSRVLNFNPARVAELKLNDTKHVIVHPYLHFGKRTIFRAAKALRPLEPP